MSSHETDYTGILSSIERAANLYPGHLDLEDRMPFMAEGDYQTYAYCDLSHKDLITAILRGVQTA